MRRRDALTALALAATVAGSPRGMASSGDKLLAELLRSAGPQSRRILASPEFELQVLWTRCKRASSGLWRVTSEHSFGIQRERWFAAASFVKLPLAALLLEQLCARGLIGQIEALRVVVDAGPACAPLPASVNDGWPLLRLLRAMCVVSDNLAYNVLYELLGSDAIHQRLGELGLADCRIAARLGCGGANRPGKLAARVLDAIGHVVWDSPRSATEQPQLFPFGRALKGRAWAEGGKLTSGPHDFSDSNFMPLPDVHRMMLELASGQPLGGGPAFALCPTARRLLAEIMALTPRACPDPVYAPDQFADDHAKWLIPLDGAGRVPAGLSIASKNAQSYGYIGDSSFIVDQARDLAFGLTAVVFVDRDGVLNDGDYAYSDIGRPFLRELGAAVLAYGREAGTRR